MPNNIPVWCPKRLYIKIEEINIKLPHLSKAKLGRVILQMGIETALMDIRDEEIRSEFEAFDAEMEAEADNDEFVD